MASPLRIALFTDTHYWPASDAQRAWTSAADAAAERDGLLVRESEAVLRRLFESLATFASGGGACALHLGDAVCGGSSFVQTPSEFSASLASFRAAEAAQLPRDWPVFHLPGNHDLSPGAGQGLVPWRHALLETEIVSTASVRQRVGPCASDARGGVCPSVSYRSVQLGRGWRLLLLDAQDGAPGDGSGHVGRKQQEWLRAELVAAELSQQAVVLAAHQLLVDPTARRARRRRRKPAGRTDDERWLGPLLPAELLGGWIGEGDMIDNRHEVLAILAEHRSTVRLSLHGHVHANTLAWAHGIPFVSLASTTEFPMQWHELLLHDGNRHGNGSADDAGRPCRVELLPRALELPALRRKSAARDTRRWRNAIKLGPPADDDSASPRGPLGVQPGSRSGLVELRRDGRLVLNACARAPAAEAAHSPWSGAT